MKKNTEKTVWQIIFRKIISIVFLIILYCPLGYGVSSEIGAEEDQNLFEILPHEIIVFIFNFLPRESLFVVNGISHHWHNMFHQTYYYQQKRVEWKIWVTFPKFTEIISYLPSGPIYQDDFNDRVFEIQCRVYDLWKFRKQKKDAIERQTMGTERYPTAKRFAELMNVYYQALGERLSFYIIRAIANIRIDIKKNAGEEDPAESAFQVLKLLSPPTNIISPLIRLRQVKGCLQGMQDKECEYIRKGVDVMYGICNILKDIYRLEERNAIEYLQAMVANHNDLDERTAWENVFAVFIDEMRYEEYLKSWKCDSNEELFPIDPSYLCGIKCKKVGVLSQATEKEEENIEMEESPSEPDKDSILPGNDSTDEEEGAFYEMLLSTRVRKRKSEEIQSSSESLKEKENMNGTESDSEVPSNDSIEAGEESLSEMPVVVPKKKRRVKLAKSFNG